MIRKYYDKILLGIALAILLAVFAFAAFRPPPKSATELVDIPALRRANTFEVSSLPEVDLSVPRWDPPPAQSAGAEWVFDVFTPPVIHFNTRTEEFIIEETPGTPRAPFGVELVDVRQALYRIQVLGYAGQAAILENRETGQIVHAREGQEYPEFEITVRSFKIEKKQIHHPGETPVTENVARVVIFDQRLNQDITLRSEERRKEEEVSALFRAVNDPNREFDVEEGDSFTHDGFTYTVEELSPPARASVTRTGGDADDSPETRTLRVRTAREERPSAEEDASEPSVEEDSVEIDF